MTMDVNHRKQTVRAEVQLVNNNEEQTELNNVTIKAPIKRSFDVAFLMLPDDKLKQKQLRAARQIASYEREHLTIQEDVVNNSPAEAFSTSEDDRRSESQSPRGLSDIQKIQNHAKYLHNITHKHQIFGDPNLSKSSKVGYEDDLSIKVPEHVSPTQKSAFTKVNMMPKEQSRMSPNLSISPDLSYQNSLSPSPPIRQYQNFQTNMLSPNQLFKAQSVTSYQNSFMQENLQSYASSPSSSGLENSFLLKSNHQGGELLPPNFAKMRPVLQYRPDLPPYAYPSFQSQEMLKMSQPDIRNPAAAAIFTSLLPPSLAALSLPAQNVCAKCNISFRMTSDLVYHMRSHHKNDIANDLSKRRREEKLKCPVCAESFRERHHLTRHMTAHQDKEGDCSDAADVQKKKQQSSSSFAVYNK